MSPSSASSAPKPAADAVHMQFDDNALLPLLFGEHDANLDRIERQLGVSVVSRGNRLAISGPSQRADQARAALSALYDRLKRGLEVDAATVDAAIRLAHSRPGEAPSPFGLEAEIHTRKRRIGARGPNQAAYIRALRSHELVFGLGPAGTGKTYLAIALAVAALSERQVGRLILTRPAVEAGERLGFLPGDVLAKVDPYMRPLFDALYDTMDPEKLNTYMERGTIEVAPLAFMRGRTLNDSFVILDEAQNTSPEQMQMFLTRLGFGSKMVVTGDVTQIDLPREQASGLIQVREILGSVDGIAFVEFGHQDVVRHKLVQRIVEAYKRHTEQTGTQRSR